MKVKNFTVPEIEDLSKPTEKTPNEAVLAHTRIELEDGRNFDAIFLNDGDLQFYLKKTSAKGENNLYGYIYQKLGIEGDFDYSVLEKKVDRLAEVKAAVHDRVNEYLA